MSAQRSARRSVAVPRLLRIVAGPAAVVDALAELIEPSNALLLVHSGERSGTGYGANLLRLATLAGMRVTECVVDANTEASVTQVEARIAVDRPSFILGVGGGRVVDVAKLAAARKGIEFISIPTQASSDGLCSPVAVIVEAGRPTSVGASIPAGIIVDMEKLESAPPITWRSGLGDLVSNISAVRDWRLAHLERGEEIDDFACLTSEAAALSVIEDDADLGEAEYRHKLIRGLILSGIAMEMAGSSRPASGSEHLISHALDLLIDRPRPHGLQVALGTIATYLLRDEDCGRLVRFFRRMDLPVLPQDLDLSVDDVVRAIRLGPQTRPDRSTFLEGLPEAAIDRLRQRYLDGSV